MESELREYKLQLEAVEVALQDSPEDAELLNLHKELQEIISLTEAAIVEEKGDTVTSTPNAATSGTRKRTADTAYSTSTDATSTIPQSYKVGDTIQARWISGDNAFYPARITSITGSTKNPVYIVSFTSYNTTETLTPKDIKPVQGYSNKKTKTMTPAASATQTPPPISSTVISQAPTINHSALEAGRKEAKDDEVVGKKAARKALESKELVKSQNKWKSFAEKGVKMGKSGKARKIGEGSMFRVPEGIHGRVGFTGSGQPMRKDIARERHIYQKGDGTED